MTRKLEASGHIRRKPAPDDKRASIVELTDSGAALVEQVKQLWSALAEQTVIGLPAETVAELPGILNTLTGNVDTRRPGKPHTQQHDLPGKSRSRLESV
jgi:DNA-binding MarR family transcriptional regulator